MLHLFYLVNEMYSKVWYGLLVVALLGVLWIGVPHAASAYHLDRGIRLLEREAELRVAIDHLETAVRLGPADTQAHRWLAKAYLRAGQPEKAITPAQQALSLSPNSPLVKLEMGDAYDGLGDAEGAVRFYEAGWVGDRLPQLLVNYLKLADESWLAGDRERARDIWRDKVLGRGDADLYAAWRLFQYCADDGEDCDFYHQQLARSPDASVLLPADSRVVKYQVEAIAGIIDADLWPAETKLHFLAYHAWHAQPTLARLVLRRLAQLVPGDADLQYYLGEYYWRQEQPALAEAAYVRAAEIAPDYAMAFLRLGMLSEDRSIPGQRETWLAQATMWYLQYQQLAPDDPLALKKLADVCEPNHCPQNTWLAELENYLIQREPEFPVNQELGDWLLVGYDVDETRLIRGEPTALWLYWRPPMEATSGPAASGTYRVGRREVQAIQDVQNPVVNLGWTSLSTTTTQSLKQSDFALGVSGLRGEFVFWSPSGTEGIVQVAPVSTNEGQDERSILFGPQFDARGGELDIPPGQIVLFSAWVRLREPTQGTSILIEDKADKWEMSRVTIEDASWQQYAVVRRTRNEATDIVMGVSWSPNNDGDWLEIRSVFVVLIPPRIE